MYAGLGVSAACASTYSIFVTNERSGDVTVIDGATQTVRATWAVGKRPRGVHVSPDGAHLYVAVSGSPILGPGAHADRAEAKTPDKAADGIAVVDPQSGAVVRKLSVGSDPEQFAVTKDGRRVIVSNEDESQASCWDLATGQRVFATPVSEEPEGVAVNPMAPEVYVTCEERGDVFVLDVDSGRKIASVRVHGRPRTVAFLPTRHRAYLPAEGDATVSVMDTDARRIVQAIHIQGADILPMCAIASADERWVYVSTGRGNSIAVIDAATNAVAAVVPVGQRPWGIALSPDGATLYAANGRSDDVSVVDVRARREVGRIKVGRGPWGIAMASP